MFDKKHISYGIYHFVAGAVMTDPVQILLSLAHMDCKQPTVSDVDKAYHLLSLKCHPDRGNGSNEQFHELTSLYERAKEAFQATASVPTPPTTMVYAVCVSALVLETGGAVPVLFNRACPHSRTGYAEHTELVNVPRRAPLPLWVHMGAVGDQSATSPIRGDVLVQFVDEIVTAGPSCVVGTRIAETHQIVAFATVVSEKEIVMGAQVQVQSPAGIVTLHTGTWPTLHAQPLVFANMGLARSDGTRDNLLLYVSAGHGAALTPRVKTALANFYDAVDFS